MKYPGKNKEIREFEEDTLKRIETGKYIKKLRLAKGETQEQLGIAIGVKKTHISEIEAGKKKITDQLVVSIAIHFNIDENILFGKLGRIPLTAMEVLGQMPDLQKALTKIHSKRIPNDRKEQAMNDILMIYERLAEGEYD
jgi:transcriptional regulator with XRE-family HTH domain